MPPFTNPRPRCISDGDIFSNDKPITHTHRVSSRHSHEQVDYSIPDSWLHLSELAPILPVENPNELSLYRHTTLEEYRRSERAYEQEQRRLSSQDACLGGHIAPGGASKLNGAGKTETWLCLPSSCAVM